MRIALSSATGYGAWFAHYLRSSGHTVDYYLSKMKYQDIMGGIARPILHNIDQRHKNESSKGYPNYAKYDLSVFDTTGRKKMADFSRRHCPTFGDGTINCILEDDRVKGIEAMEAAGISVPPYERFNDIGAAKAYVKKHGKRYVFKPDSSDAEGQDPASTYVSKDAEDLLEYFDKLSALSKGVKFILQEFIGGTECSVEGWFNGSEFYCLNGTLEDKKFMSGNIGPNTGCAGNLVFTLSSESKIFQKGLGKARDILRDGQFVGNIDLNCIITEGGELYGLEWTPRFGYDATATFARIYGGDFGELMYRCAVGKVPEESWANQFGVSARISIPPYPTEMRTINNIGKPIKGIEPEDLEHTYLYDAKLEKGKLVCSGVTGFIACPIVCGPDPTKIFDTLKTRVEAIQIPDMQYRDDLKKSILKRYYELEQKGWL
jgi:phosphoribosylamine-glycine ligase